MVTDNQRREVAQELRELRHTTYYSEEIVENICDAISIADPANTFREPEDVYKLLADLIEPQPIDGNTSDGYHTFNELYHHRAVLLSVIVENFAARAWKSKLHADGTMYEGMFIVGIETPDGQATYHYDMPYWNLFRCKEVDRAPEWDGHTPDQAIERIGKLVDCKTDRPTCRLDLTDVETYGNLKVRIYECSECGRTCEEIYGKYERCPHCGAEVIDGNR
ncbi:hypothetical protein [Collinsella bouchesdurhonensis]|uniref:WDGH domain-containing protein n=1 Tax=Collinsella bouchesdurhonensis TaxID=1907654 RepID=UPI00189BC1E2|nr:hypothetical protein [Collinsella bouchesdurhonensis]